jgi:butyrate kinase
MFDIEASFDRVVLSEPRDRPTVLFIEPEDPRMVEAACHLARYIRPVFLGRESDVRAVIAREIPALGSSRIEFTLSESAFVTPESRPDLLEEFAGTLRAFHAEKGRELGAEEAAAMVREPGHFGILAVKCGHADMVVGGARIEPRNFFRPMVEMLAQQDTRCEAGVFVLPDDHPEGVYPHNIVVFGDVGVNPSMTAETLAHTAVGTCAIARDLIPEEVLPEIHAAIVSYSHHGGDEGPSVERVRKAMELIPAILDERCALGERYRSIRIEGEVKMSAALSARSAKYYEHGSGQGWKGSPNVIISPNLDMGNLLYHLYATRFPTAKKFPMLFGVRFRGVALPMDCATEDVRLAVKAAVLRTHKFGAWTRTPKDTFFRRYRVLAINPGSTSTKIAVFEGDQERFTEEIQHPAADLLPFEGKPITAQYAFRKETILRFLSDRGLGLADFDAFAGRGGLLRPIPHGTYAVDEAMLEDLRASRRGDHASNLGGLIARELGDGGIPAFIVDPVVVDEADPRVRVSGLKELPRRVISHALNQIATARRFAEERETFYSKVNVIVAHLGGGITVGAHRKGRYIDVNNGLDGEGPFSPQRTGSLPTGQLIDLCFSGKYTQPELKKLNKGRGGLIDLLGTADLREVERRMDAGEAEAALVWSAMGYHIAKEIASLVPAFEGTPVDRVLLTGGMARSKRLVDEISRLVSGLGCGVTVYPGENEMAALVKGALRVLQGKEEARRYGNG